MPVQRLCRITELSKLGGGAFQLWFEAGEMAGLAQPGQFVHIQCGKERLLRRPISICGRRGDELRIIFDLRGKGTEWLSQRTAGEQLDVLGPLGRGFWLTGGRILFVGGGMGTPPLLWAAQSVPEKAEAVLAFRCADRAILIGEFKTACEQTHITCDDGSLGAKGFAHEAAERLLAAGKAYDGICACGPRAMLKAVAETAARHKIPCQVSLEERMGCGVGACLVCACKTIGADGAEEYSHVCKDGPVFDAERVVWDD